MDEWRKITDEIPRNTDILFMTGDDEVHDGFVNGEEKIRKCEFFSFRTKKCYDSDSSTPLPNRVISWHPLPEKP